MPLDRDTRKIQNSKQNVIADIDTYPSGENVPDGDLVIAIPLGKPLRLYKKLKGMLWWTNFTKDGNQTVEKDLEVKGSANIKSNLTIKNNLGVNELDMDAPIHVTASDNTASIIIEENHSTGGGELIFRSSDALTNASATTDFLGGILWSGWDGDSFEYGAQIRARPQATWSGSSRSTMLQFMTTPTSSTTTAVVMTLDNAGNLGIGVSPLANADLTLEGGAIALKETTTPSNDTNYGKIYTKSDNKLYFQDGGGSEHEISFESL
jgi:hypothetical protein